MKIKDNHYQYIKQIVIVSLFIIKIISWQQIFIFQTLRPYHSSLKGYTFVQFTENNQLQILLFGGMTSSGILTSDLFQINTITKVATKLTSYPAPSQRYHMCSTYANEKMYIFGGKFIDGSLSSELWQYDTIINKWSQHISYTQGLFSCFIIGYGSQLFIMGGNESNNAVLFSYRYLLNFWQSKSYIYYGLIKFQTTLWDNTIINTTLDISNKNSIDQNQLSFLAYEKSSTLFMDSVCSRHLNSYSSFIYFATRQSIYRMRINNLEIEWLISFDIDIKSTDTFKCIANSNWFFVVISDDKSTNANQNNLKSIQIRYYNLNNFSINGRIDKIIGGNIQAYATFLSTHNVVLPMLFWPSSIQTFQIFMDSQQNLYLLSDSDITSYILTNDCAFTKNNFIKSCFYGKTICQSGYTGYQCTIATNKCQNTLILYDEISFSKIQTQCSGNGICLNSGCLCFDKFGGSDCSIYNRKICKGNLVYNYPVMNCQCTSDTTGGNNCQVQFCYNDCSQHGACQINGQCICNSNYQGSDCSVLIIQFPS